MSETLSVFRVMPENKKEIQKFGDELLNSVLIGDENPLEIDGRLKALEELINYVRKSDEFQEYLLNEAEKEGAKSFERGSFKYQVKETGTKYDYSQCGDTILNNLEKNKASIDNKIKVRKNTLKTLNFDSDIFDAETGEKLYPPSKTSTTKVITILR